MSLRLLLISTVTLFFGTSVFSQITIDNTPSPAQLVNNLIGTGVTVSNITFTGNTNQIGAFNGTASNIGLPNGLILSTGNVTDIAPPVTFPSTAFGNPGNPDLLSIAQSVSSNPSAGSITSTNDAAILEFDFVPTGDSVQFNFVFASEEYETWINTEYNDVFGFFISGPGFAGPYASPGAFPMGAENLAFVPGTTDPITISTIHPGLNSAYYINNSGSTHSMNGFTVPMTIAFQVVCNETYHFKFALADCQDGTYDTGVFLEGNSFSSDIVQVSVAPNSNIPGDTVVFEGCTFADLIFSRYNTTDTLTLTYDITGTAIDGTDYATLGTSVTFLPGQDTVILTLNPIDDGLSEPAESVTITAYTLSPCGDTIVSSGTIWILDEPNMVIDEDDPLLFCVDEALVVNAIASGGFAPYDYSWTSNPSTTSQATINASAQGITEYYVTATDGCGFTVTDTVTINLNQSLAIDTVISYPSTVCEPTGAVSGITSGMTGTPLYQWTGPGAGNPNFIDATVWEDLSSGWYYFSVTDDVCQLDDSVFVDVEPPPIASFTANPIAGCSPLEVVFTNNSSNATNYEWNFDGIVVTTSSTTAQNQTFTNSAVIQLVAFDAGGCSDTTYATVTVAACGCTDPSAQNYDPNAVIDDGSCFHPQPVIYVPNVFTPNNDFSNDEFFITVENAIDLEFMIFNRWGNVVYEASGLNSKWNGFLEGGSYAEDGTYFVKYTVTGIEGTVYEGHGFVQLVDGLKP